MCPSSKSRSKVKKHFLESQNVIFSLKIWFVHFDEKNNRRLHWLR